MNATPDSAALSFSVRVVPYEGGWCVTCGTGYYATPMEKDAAIERAMELAAQSGLSQIAVCNADGYIVEVLRIKPS